MPNKLKYIYECTSCNKQWKGYGVHSIFCKKCKKYFKVEYKNPNEKHDYDNFPKIYGCKCIRKNKNKKTKNKFIENPTYSFAKCFSCYYHVQGFLYSEFNCKYCKKYEFVEGLQEYINKPCKCGELM